jgi:hypothetical protein
MLLGGNDKNQREISRRYEEESERKDMVENWACCTAGSISICNNLTHTKGMYVRCGNVYINVLWNRYALAVLSLADERPTRVCPFHERHS